jgi:class 3 adenylate cyclase/tetratricopeptide (TPR) repeat protein
MPACPSCGTENPAQARFCLACGAPLTAPAEEIRKTVTIVFADVKGSTALGEQFDPEATRRLMTRWFDEARATLERHGGTVEKFIGDAVMAVFGMPELHEDDALRAVRAALEMRDRLAAVNAELERDFGVHLEVRTGVNTGEVAAGGGRALITGDAVNVAARLEQSAAPGEILVGAPTYELVSEGVEAEVIEPLSVKGKSQPLAAWRLLAVRPEAEAVPRRLESELVGRDAEFARLRAVYEQAKADRACRVITVVGEPGIGKSRLAEELLRSVREEATVLRGRCLSYGDGITYWPLVEIVREQGGRARELVGELLEGEPEAELVADRIASAVGESDSAASADEISWAVRRLCERVARNRPLVVVVDDIQWAEPTFFDLLDHVSLLSRGPILLLCLARPDLRAVRPGWAAPAIELRPLSASESSALVARLAGDGTLDERTRTEIAIRAGGNPLFVEQMLAMAQEHGGDAVSIPPTIQALLAARLDRLEPNARAAIGRAAVIGQEFWASAVAALMPDDTQTAAAVLELVRQGLVRPYESAGAAGDAFWFVHLLVRDAAYAGLPKALRAELHERFAAWIAPKGDDPGARHEEIVGYHLEQAVGYRRELGEMDEDGLRLAREAAERLGHAGAQAAARGDAPAAANLLGRAADLRTRDDPQRIELLLDLSNALTRAGELGPAAEAVDEALAHARASRDHRLEQHALVARQHLLLLTDPEGRIAEVQELARSAIAVFEELGDAAGLANAWNLLGSIGWMTCRFGESAEALERAADYARRAGDRAQEGEIIVRLSGMIGAGPAPVPDAIAKCRELIRRLGDDRTRVASLSMTLAVQEAMSGSFDAARARCADLIALLEELGLRLALAGGRAILGLVELLADDPVAAERELRAASAVYEEMGEHGYLSTRAAELAEALYRQGRDAEAEPYTYVSERTAASDDIESQARLRAVRAKVLARRSERHEADRLIGEALELIAPTDFVRLQCDVLLAAAEVARLAGRDDEAEAMALDARARFEAKGVVPGIDAANRFLAEPVAGRE